MTGPSYTGRQYSLINSIFKAAPPSITGRLKPCLFSSSRFSFMTCVDFTSSPLMPRATPFREPFAVSNSFSFSINSPMSALMPIFMTLKPLFVSMMSTRFLPTSCTSPFTVPRISVVWLVFSLFGRYGARESTAAFIVSADWSTKGSCIRPSPKSSPTSFIAPISSLLTIVSAAISFLASGSKASSRSLSPAMRSLWILISVLNPSKSSLTRAPPPPSCAAK